MTHTLRCSIEGLVIACHNKIHDKLLYLSQLAFTSEYVRAETIIQQGRTRPEQEICQGSDKHKDIMGDVMIQDLWDRKVDAIIDIKLGDADADTYIHEPIKKLLARWENIKKNKHRKNCNNQWKQFSPFVLSVKKLLGREYLVVISQLI